MKGEKKYFSYKKGMKKQILYSLILLVTTVIIISLGYVYFNKVSYGRDMGGFDPFSDNLIVFLSLKLKDWGIVALTIIVAIVILVLTLFLLYQSFKYFFLRERVVLVKVVRMSVEIKGEDTDIVDYSNASLSKTLAKNFKQVTLHQKAIDGKIDKINIFASQEKLFFYPKASVILSRLAGICKTLGLEIQPFSKQDHELLFNDLSLKHGNPVLYQTSGLLLLGEPAYQHINRNTKPIDALVESIVKKSKLAEVHSFSSICKGSPIRFWFRKRNKPRTRDRRGKERTLTKLQQHVISETEDMTTTGFVKGEIAVLIKGNNQLNVEEIQDEMWGSLETIYSGFVRDIKLSITNPQKIVNRIKNHELVGGYHSLISGYSARAIIDVYRKPISGIHLSKDVTTPPSFERPNETHPIVLGETITGEVIRTNLKDHIHHCGIFGTTGYGKSDWIRAEKEQITDYYPNVRIVTFDFDGEHSSAFINHPDFLVLEANNPDAPLHINPFHDDFADKTEHADSLFKYFNEILTIDQKYAEFTPPQKAMLWEGIIITTEQDDSEDKNYLTFERNLRKYVEENQREFVRGDMSILSLINKLRFYKRGLRNIVMCKKSNFTMDMLERTNVIFNLKSIRDDTYKRAITTLILYQLRNYMLFKGPQDLWLKVYIEEATVVTPKSKHHEKKLFIEECLEVIRKYGASITLIGVTAEKVTESILESKYLVNSGCISDDLCKSMNTDIKTQHTLKKFQLDIKLPNEEYPIRLVKLTRPKRKKLSEDEIDFIIKTSPKYEFIRNNSFLLEDLEIDNINNKYSVITNCFDNCSFKYLQKKECHLSKKTKLTQKLKELTADFVRNDCKGWEGVKDYLERDFVDCLDLLAIKINTELPEDEYQIGRRKIDSDDKNHLQKCVLTWILQGLVREDVFTVNQALSYFVDYDDSIAQAEQSAYFPDYEITDYQFDGSEYNECWEEN